ncbi:hypothetical protein E4U39_002610 [Claviceps sp. Clav50 group G5]|nr:hypothetical protein E4U39_002610 [Claviceps sp. Clav50 group G5]
MKFYSPFFFFVFGALVTPIIGHAVPNVEEGVDVVERDFAGAPAHLFARKKRESTMTGSSIERKCHSLFCRWDFRFGLMRTTWPGFFSSLLC